jgi:hypothetical protein
VPTTTKYRYQRKVVAYKKANKNKKANEINQLKNNKKLA